jgi:hypothetical protein
MQWRQFEVLCKLTALRRTPHARYSSKKKTALISQQSFPFFNKINLFETQSFNEKRTNFVTETLGSIFFRY